MKLKQEIGNLDCIQIEEEILKWWQDEKIFEKIKEKELQSKDKRFFFLDGPPYTTGEVHLGTAWNKILKDFVIRYKRMRGLKVVDTPGYDTHGLPIEVLMEKKLGMNSKKDIEKFGLSNFITECREYALSKIDSMNLQFKRLGCTFWNWDNPYITLKNTYVQGIWWTLKKAWENNLLYPFYRPQNCCPRCATALAKHEWEYNTIKDTAIFVKYQTVEDPKTFYVIWTTTPWTLVSNTNIMVNPDIEYVKMRVKDETWIFGIASTSDLLQNKLDLDLNTDDGFSYGERIMGYDLEGKEYIHPLADEVPFQKELKGQEAKVHTILLSREYVQESGGSGMVHCAPGHGPEDFEVGVANGIPVFSPVDEKGCYTEEGGTFEGKFVHETNEEIMALLKKKGTLIYQEKIDHEYAHCWRCKSKLVYRATDQWFFKTTELKEEMLKENEQIYWIPKRAGENSFKSWLKNLRDWCISRQRYWGIPLSIWTCDNEECDDVHVIGSMAELKEMAGTCPEDIHKPWIDEVTWPCKKCNGTMTRIPDVLDVWLDSGSVMWASQMFVDGEEHYDSWEAADFILEGKDQIRGWFNSLLCSAMVSSKRRNYDACYMHGWINSHGVKMSKSLGNTILPQDVIEGRIEILSERQKKELAEKAAKEHSSKFDKTKDIKKKQRKKKYLKDVKKWSNVKGIEPFRIYSGTGTKAGNDLNLDHKEYADIYRNLDTMWNTFKYGQQKMQINGFDPEKDQVPYDDLDIMDKWIISRTNVMVNDMTEIFDKYLLHEAPGRIIDFIINEVSRWYIMVIRARVEENYDGGDKKSALWTLWYVLYRCALVLSPINPMITEKLYQIMFRVGDPKNMKLSMSLEEWPEVNPDYISEEIEEMMELTRKIIDGSRKLKQENNIKLRWQSKALYVQNKGEEELSILQDLAYNMSNVSEFLMVDKPVKGKTIVSTDIDNMTLYLDIEQTDEIKQDSIYSDLMRSMQFMRKTDKYNSQDKIELHLASSDKFILKVLNDLTEEIKGKMNADSIEIHDSPISSEDGWSYFDFSLCTHDDCYTYIRGKTIEQMKSGKKSITCGYCNSPLSDKTITQINVKFKKV